MQHTLATSGVGRSAAQDSQEEEQAAERPDGYLGQALRCFPLMRKPDWTIYHKVMKKLKGTERAAVDAWT